MAKPARVVHLVKGKLIDVQAGFVDTFNYILDFVENIIGEGELNAGKSLVIDRSIPDRPVICGGGDGGNVDNISIDKDGADDTIEIKGFLEADDEESSLIRLMTSDAASATGKSVISRYNPGSETDNELHYRTFGELKKGQDSNIVFTSVPNSKNVEIDVYYV